MNLEMTLHQSSKTSNIETSKEVLEELRTMNNADGQIKHRSDYLPRLFRLKGKPYSLKDYPQFKEMYPDVLIPEVLFMCGRQIGKSMNLSRSEILDCLAIPHFQILYIAPLESQTQRYSILYLREAIQSCYFANVLQTYSTTTGKDSAVIKSVMHQTFGNGSGIQLSYAKTSSDRTRGIFADRLDLDEIQDQLVDNLKIIAESLTSSSYGIKRYTGTAKTTDNIIEELWQSSSQCEWVMKCSCGHWNVPNLEGKILDMISRLGPVCVRCRKKLNVREGTFVPGYPDRMNTFRGYHIPQIVVPAIAEDPVKWAALYQKLLKMPYPLILQEVLGISCSVGARIITQEDIEKVSVLPEMKELQKHKDEYVITVGGVDWGIAEHTSFTVHTIIGVKPGGKVHVLWAKRFIGFNPDETLQSIAQAHFYYNCQVLAADFGMGFDKNYLLARKFGLPVVEINYVRQGQLLTYSPIHDRSRWCLDKTTALELVFLAIKYGNILFPPQSEFRVFTDDLLSPYEEAVEIGGVTTRHFLRNPKRPDDFAHALTFAVIVAMKLLSADISNIVPSDALGTLNTAPPTITPNVDPADILGKISS